MFTLRGKVVDADTNQIIGCRVYINSQTDKWYFPTSVSPDGTAIEYKRQFSENSLEMHTTLSAHPFTVELPPGEYTVTAERGKEYFPLTRKIIIAEKNPELTFRLRRWINMADLGWYSGDTHVHRSPDELPNVQLAEDLNVSFPLPYWIQHAGEHPCTGLLAEPHPIYIDRTHVIYPMNTEYEICYIGGKSHQLGSVIILNHRSVCRQGAPPVTPLAEQAHSEQALLELDKHNWPWSMMIVAVMNVDLYELSNNHLWRTEFGVKKWAEPPAEYMNIEMDSEGFTEFGWIMYGLENYYALLNCGFNLRPTAGTASGVHPVPLGFGRVYVKIEDEFSYEAWIDGLDAGRSFVTTGPILLVTVNDRQPGHIFKAPADRYVIKGTVESINPLESIEVIVNGDIAETVTLKNQQTPKGTYLNRIDTQVTINSSSWIAVRCFERRPDGRFRFAHTGPFHIEVPNKPLWPRKEQIAFLIERVQQQLKRNENILSKESLDEYRKAVNIYRKIADTVESLSQ